MALLTVRFKQSDRGERNLSVQNQIADTESGGFKTLQRLAVWLAICLLVSENLPAQVFKEYDLKGLFLYNFGQFVDWPSDAFPSPTSPLMIGVLGQDRFGKSLDDLTQTENLAKRK